MVGEAAMRNDLRGPGNEPQAQPSYPSHQVVVKVRLHCARRSSRMMVESEVAAHTSVWSAMLHQRCLDKSGYQRNRHQVVDSTSLTPWPRTVAWTGGPSSSRTGIW